MLQQTKQQERERGHGSDRHWRQEALSSSSAITNKTTTAIHDLAVAFAQGVERDSFRRLNLSVQELIDCDTSADQGCTGGNPLLAFYFIHRYGLTSWNDYPYVGFEDTCKDKLVEKPVATVKSWGIVAPNHENHMELVLRYIGPIAVGVNGGSRSFLSYSGGIFNKPDCEQGANHALLITGYGQETQTDGSLVRYFIARNSWGAGWGEDGYIRIQRGDGSRGTPGVCGIARSPSVALGGILLSIDGGSSMDSSSLRGGTSKSRSYEGESLDTESPLVGWCSRVGWSDPDTHCMQLADWVDSHRAMSLGFVGIFFGLLSIWPLTRDCRRRRRARRRRALRRQAKEERRLRNGHLSDGELSGSGSSTNTDWESSPLLAGAKDPPSYGAPHDEQREHS